MSVLDQAERAAETHRTTFALALEELDRRRKLALDLPYQVRAHVAAVAVGAATLSLGVAAWVLLVRPRRRNRRLLLTRALARASSRPERFAILNEPALWARLGQKVLLGVAGTLASQLARRTTRALLERGAEPAPS